MAINETATRNDKAAVIETTPPHPPISDIVAPCRPIAQ